MLVASCVSSAIVYTVLCNASRVLSPIWSLNYRTTLTIGERRHWDSLFPSTVHALVSVSLSVYLILQYWNEDDSLPSSSPVFAWNVPLSYTALGASLAYFCADMVYLTITTAPTRDNRNMVVHHACCLVGLSAALWTGFGHVHVLIMLLTESTTPFINVRWILDKTGQKTTHVYLINGVLMTGEWFVARVIIFPVYFAFLSKTYEGEMRDHLPTCVRALFMWLPLLLFALNAYWFYLILRGLLKHARLRTKIN